MEEILLRKNRIPSRRNLLSKVSSFGGRDSLLGKTDLLWRGSLIKGNPHFQICSWRNMLILELRIVFKNWGSVLQIEDPHSEILSWDTVIHLLLVILLIKYFLRLISRVPQNGAKSEVRGSSNWTDASGSSTKTKNKHHPKCSLHTALCIVLRRTRYTHVLRRLSGRIFDVCGVEVCIANAWSM